jgi:hypothetical protein
LRKVPPHNAVFYSPPPSQDFIFVWGGARSYYMLSDYKRYLMLISIFLKKYLRFEEVISREMNSSREKRSDMHEDFDCVLFDDRKH